MQIQYKYNDDGRLSKIPGDARKTTYTAEINILEKKKKKKKKKTVTYIILLLHIPTKPNKLFTSIAGGSFKMNK